MDAFINFFTTTPLWELLLIFFAKIIEVTIGTLRIILISKGYRKYGVFLSFFEVMLWVFIASRVITGISEAPLKAIVYCFGFAAGVFFGSLLESKIAFGKILIQAIVEVNSAEAIATALRNDGNGVTVIKGEGKTTQRRVLMIFAQRRDKHTIYDTISKMEEKAVIVSNEVSELRGGYLHSWRRVIK